MSVDSQSLDALRHLLDIRPRTGIMAKWERCRHGHVRYVAEFIAEAMGTFLYTWAGVGSTAAWTLGNMLDIPGLGSLFQAGCGYAIGIVLALVVCLPTSRGYFNPAFTICAVIAGECPPTKALRLIIAQIVGAYVACMLVYVQYYNMITPAEQLLISKGTWSTDMFTSTGIGGVFALYDPTENLGYVFLNEFVCDFVIALVVFTAFDPTNHMAPPSAIPWLIGFTYGIVVWGFAGPGVATNTARDVGARLMALTIWGMQASGGRYAAIAALGNIAATLFAMAIYEFAFKDMSRTITPSAYDWARAMEARDKHRARMVEVEVVRGNYADEEKQGKPEVADGE